MKLIQKTYKSASLKYLSQSTYIYRVQCTSMSPRRNWDSPTPSRKLHAKTYYANTIDVFLPPVFKKKIKTK